MIILLSSGTQYEVGAHFFSGIAAGFESIGFHTEIIDRSDANFGMKLMRLVETNDVYSFFSFGYGGFYLTNDSTSFYDTRRIPLFSFLIDHPIYIRVVNNRPWDDGARNHVMSCVDEFHSAFLRQEVSQSSVVSFIPHGTSIRRELEALKPLADRNIDVLFAGTYVNPDAIRDKWINSGLFTKLFDDIALRGLTDKTTPFHQIVDESVSTVGLIRANVIDQRKFWYMISEIDKYIRARIRDNVLRSLVGFDVQLYGNGWHEFSQKFTVHGPASFAVIQEAMMDSKVVLNVIGNSRRGLHERMLETMSNRSVSLTDSNEYINEQFPGAVLTYDRDQTEQVRSLLSKYMENPEDLQKVADLGYLAVKNRHTWTHRAQQVINALEVHKTFYA